MFAEPVVVIFSSLNILMLFLGIPCCFFPKLVPTLCLELFSYGKSSDLSKLSKIVRAIQVPKRWFSHFYIFGAIYSSTTVVILLYNAFHGANAFSPTLFAYVQIFSANQELVANPNIGLCAATLFFIHLLRRLYETAFLNIFSEAKMNVVHYLSGMVHYFGAITSLLVYSIDQKRMGQDSPGISNHQLFLFALGTVLFVLASYLQYKSNLILIALRSGKKVKRKYFVPMGWLFNYVSCPHYFCEIIIYISLYVILGLNHYPWGLITFWVVLNQILSGWMSHKWYLNNMKTYPRRRKAVIPFLL